MTFINSICSSDYFAIDGSIVIDFLSAEIGAEGRSHHRGSAGAAQVEP
jgi:hypothetical protein